MEMRKIINVKVLVCKAFCRCFSFIFLDYTSMFGTRLNPLRRIKGLSTLSAWNENLIFGRLLLVRLSITGAVCYQILCLAKWNFVRQDMAVVALTQYAVIGQRSQYIFFFIFVFSKVVLISDDPHRFSVFWYSPKGQSEVVRIDHPY